MVKEEQKQVEKVSKTFKNFSGMLLFSLSVLLATDYNFLVRQYIAFRAIVLFSYKLKNLQALNEGENKKCYNLINIVLHKMRIT